MARKQKRTYNLAPRTVRAVRELAVDELHRRLRESAEADAWEAAARDEAFVGEANELEEAFATADRETWPA